MRGGEKQNKNQRPLRTTVHTLVIIVTRAQGSGSPPPQSWRSPPGPEAGKGQGEGGGAPYTHFHQGALSGTRERREQLLVLLDSKLDIVRVGGRKGTS